MRPRGNKPPHLWRLTPLKDFLSVSKDRLSVQGNLEERNKKDFIQMVAAVITSGMAVLYSFGHFEPKRNVTSIVKPDAPKETPKKEKCKKPDKLPPCKP